VALIPRFDKNEENLNRRWDYNGSQILMIAPKEESRTHARAKSNSHQKRSV
jgi:hypothetical protein